jgi:hypothetical protein
MHTMKLRYGFSVDLFGSADLFQYWGRRAVTDLLKADIDGVKLPDRAENSGTERIAGWTGGA